MTEYTRLFNETTGDFDEIDVDTINIGNDLRVNNIEPLSGTTVFFTGSIDVSANIVVGGTVDGIDLQNLNTQVQAIQTEINQFPDDLKNLTASEIQQIGNIDLVTISNTQWSYLGSLNQNVSTSSSVTFSSVSTDNIQASTVAGINFNSSNFFNVNQINGFHLDRFLRNSTSTSAIGRVPYYTGVNNQIGDSAQLTFSAGVLFADTFSATSEVLAPIVRASTELQTNKITDISGGSIDFNGKNITNVLGLTAGSVSGNVLTNSINTVSGSDISLNSKNLVSVGLINGFDISTAGDVSGPASSVNNTIPTFDGITGKVIKSTGFWEINPSNGALSSSSNCDINLGLGELNCNVVTTGQLNTPDLNASNNADITNNLTVGNVTNLNLVTCSGSASFSSLLTATGTTTISSLNAGFINFGQDNLNYYDEYSQTFSLTGVSGSSSANVKFIRVGKLVTIQWDAWTFVGLGSAAATSNSTFPSQFDSPVGNLQFFVRVVVGGTTRTGFFRINTDQTFTIYSDVATGGGVWTSLAGCTVNAGSCSYTLL